MNLEDALSAPPNPPRADRAKPGIPSVGDPGTSEWNGYEGWINTQPTTEHVTEYAEFLRDAFPGIDPAELEVLEPVQVRGWDAVKKEWNSDLEDFESNVVRMHYYRLNVRKRRPGPALNDLLEIVKKKKPSKRPAPTGDATYVVALGDLQLGKMDGDGAEGTLQRVVDGIEQSAERIQRMRKIYPVEAIHCAWLGDCIEGFVSQGGNNAWRTTLTYTEQVRLLRRIMMLAVETFAPLAERLSMAAVPGNHDQAVRFGKGLTRYDDSFDVEALCAVADACAVNPAAFGNVQFWTPARDELTVTLETSGTILGHAHGHQFKGGYAKWWQGQSFGDHPVGQAHILLAGHLHQWRMEQLGKNRLFIQVPALEQESTWWRHRTGDVGFPGVLNFITSQGKIAAPEVV